MATNILQRLKLFLTDPPAEQPSSHNAEERHMAMAVLLVHAAGMDGEIAPEERRKIQDLLVRHVDIPAEDAGSLLAAAESRESETVEIFTYTAQIVAHFSEEERILLIEMLWEVAYADGVLNDFEANLLRRIGGLIYVTDRDRGRAQQRVKERLVKE